MKKKKENKKLFGRYYQVIADEKKIEYNFPSKKAENQYIDICKKVWGGIPMEVLWAQGSQLYKDELKSLQKV